jgi:CBS domain-containing protein
MNNALRLEAIPRLKLDADTAADLMTANPVSVRDIATLKEAVALLIDRGISAAPVIDDAGRPVGVLSRTDVIVHSRERAEYLEPVPEYFDKDELVTRAGDVLTRGFQVERVDRTRVHELMTPVVFSVGLETPAHKVIEEMLALKIHRLFVVDEAGILVGVISALDVLRHLKP